MADFDAIVVGSGCAGSVAAYEIAKAGKSVLVVERGNFAGAKNMTGGRIYGHCLRAVFPDNFDEIPFERKVSHERISLMSPNSNFTIDFTSEDLLKDGQESYTVLRAPFDQWLAEQAENAGAEYICGIAVEKLIKDENGNDFVIDPNKDDSQFIKPCDESELARLSKFAVGFVDRYLTYTSGAVDPSYGYQRLMPYLKLGADLDTRMKEAMDGLSWAHTASVRVNSTVLNNATAIGDGFYICDITANATTFVPGKGEVEDTSNMRVIVVDTNDDIRAISLELY